MAIDQEESLIRLAKIDAAAMMDGAGPMRVLWSVILPQSRPVILAVSIFHITWAWNDYYGPLVYLVNHQEMQPISVALSRFIYSKEVISGIFRQAQLCH
jgi:multiple sugar transport system permease protein